MVVIAATMRRRRLQRWGRGVGDSVDGDGGDKEEDEVVEMATAAARS